MNFNKTTAIMIAISLMLTMAVSLVALPIANAHDPPVTWPTFAYIAVTPDPIGVGQPVYVVVWVSPNPPTAIGIAGDRWRDFTVKVTAPNGDIKTLGPWNSDPTGSTFTSYTPDQEGTYKFEFNYPGQVMTDTGPTGITAPMDLLIGRAADVYINDTYLGSSATTTLTVQADPVERIPDSPLPTSYWTRPIYGQNSDWANTVASNWLGGAIIGSEVNLWQKDGAAPGSSHVMWTMPIEFGGIVGGTSDYSIPDVGFYSGGSYEGRLAQAIIIGGRLYFQMPLNHAGGSRSSGEGYICLDLRTGEEIWLNEELGATPRSVFGGSDRPTIKGQLFNYESQNQHGVVGGTIWDVRGNTWDAYDAWTGEWIYTLTDVPSGTEAMDDMGGIVRYVLNYNTTAKSGWLALWNNTQHNVGLELVQDMTSSEAYQWRPMGKTVNMSTAYSWNATISADLTGRASPSIVRAIPGDIILGTSTNYRELGRFSGTPDPYTIWAISDKPGTRGNMLWKKDYSAPAGGVTRNFGYGDLVDLENRVFFMQDIETMSWLGYDLDSGALLWGPVSGAENAFTYYGSGHGGGQTGFVAYGNLYAQGYGGELCCFDGATGQLLWRYNNTNSGIETVWGNYPIFIAAIADGKVYAFNNEHSPNYPLYKGEKVRCINATTGEEIWTMLSWAGQIGGGGSSTSLLADGFFVYYNYYDNQVYCVGKGPSATTVSINNDVVSEGNTVLIKGMVTDESAGAKRKVESGEFTMVPAVSDESMGPWMEYIYMQQPCPQDVKGVDVLLQTLDPNGNFYDIGTATTDGNGMYKLSWEPPVPGEYAVIATFQGSESYWTSYSETAFAVTEASPTPPPEEPLTLPPTEMYVLVTGIAIIIAIAIGVVLILRKR